MCVCVCVRAHARVRTQPRKEVISGYVKKGDAASRRSLFVNQKEEEERSGERSTYLPGTQPGKK